MHVHPWIWAATLGTWAALLAVDIFVLARRPHEPSMREAAGHLAVVVAAAVLFAAGVWITTGGNYGAQFVAGWLTEYSLSVDNLFVFLIILTKLRVPRPLQASALLAGIVLAIVFRGLFVAAGAAAINRFSWVFYLFGAFLIYTAAKLARESGHSEPGLAVEDAEYEQPRAVRWLSRIVPSTEQFHGTKLSVRSAGKRLATPMLVVIATLGVSDLLFALDSIPAIYGITKEPYLVLTANMFALMGLRQLYFLIGGLLQRLVYLSLGLSFLLAFIGVKLILHAMHENELGFINSGQHIGWAPDIPIWVSLLVIVATLGVTTTASLWRTRVRIMAS